MLLLDVLFHYFRYVDDDDDDNGSHLGLSTSYVRVRDKGFMCIVAFHTYHNAMNQLYFYPNSTGEET